MWKIAKRLLLFGASIISIGWLTPCITHAWDCEFGFWSDCGVSEVKVPGSVEHQEDALLHTIQTAINWILWLLALISLILSLYAWFKMLTSGWDSKKYGEGFGILKSAALWLAIIWTSRLIVSLIFYIINGSINWNISWW
jgi:hypothetical protein